MKSTIATGTPFSRVHSTRRQRMRDVQAWLQSSPYVVSEPVPIIIGLEELLLSNVSTVECGMFKCFFPARNRTMGYIVQAHSTASAAIGGLAWQYANRLSTKFGAKHLQLGPSTVVNVTASLAHLFHDSRPSRHPGVPNHKIFYPHQLSSLQHILVTPVRPCPKPCYVIKCDRHRWPATFETIAFKKQLPSEDRKRAFLGKLASALSESERMLESEACLHCDVQMFMTSEADLFHLDLERCFASELPSSFPEIKQASLKWKGRASCRAAQNVSALRAQHKECFADFHRFLHSQLGHSQRLL